LPDTTIGRRAKRSGTCGGSTSYDIEAAKIHADAGQQPALRYRLRKRSASTAPCSRSLSTMNDFAAPGTRQPFDQQAG
jgi:hypothetical protein